MMLIDEQLRELCDTIQCWFTLAKLLCCIYFLGYEMNAMNYKLDLNTNLPVEDMRQFRSAKRCTAFYLARLDYISLFLTSMDEV
jgi:hypothetical protein